MADKSPRGSLYPLILDDSCCKDLCAANCTKPRDASKAPLRAESGTKALSEHPLHRSLRPILLRRTRPFRFLSLYDLRRVRQAFSGLPVVCREDIETPAALWFAAGRWIVHNQRWFGQD